MELAEIRPFEPQMAEIDLFTMPDAVGVGEPSVRKVKPYIAGHVTDGSSTFTFTVNVNESVTVPVDANGDWKWVVDRTITSLNSAFENKTNVDKLFLYKLDLRIKMQRFFANNGTSTYHIIDISKCYFIGGGDTTTWFTSASKCVVYLPIIIGTIYGILSSQTQAFATKDILYDTIQIESSNGLTKENVLSFIKHAAISLTIKLSSTIYAKCKQDGEWYDDIQAAIDAKALEGYTVTLISA